MKDENNGVFIDSKVPKGTRYLIEYLNSEHSHREKIAQVLKFAEVNKGKVKSLSKRNQKRLLSRLGWHWNEETGKLVDELKYRRSRGFSPYATIKMEMRFTEKMGKPMSNMLDAWVQGLLND